MLEAMPPPTPAIALSPPNHPKCNLVQFIYYIGVVMIKDAEAEKILVMTRTGSWRDHCHIPAVPLHHLRILNT